MSNPFITIANRKVGLDFPPLVIAEIGINHEGSVDRCQRNGRCGITERALRS